MDKKYIVIYEEDAKRIFDLFSFEGEEDFKEQVKFDTKGAHVLGKVDSDGKLK